MPARQRGKGGILSTVQLSALTAASGAPLTAFRRGFAVSKSGPFYSPRTIGVLNRHGFVTLNRASTKVRITEAVRAYLVTRLGVPYGPEYRPVRFN